MTVDGSALQTTFPSVSATQEGIPEKHTSMSTSSPVSKHSNGSSAVPGNAAPLGSSVSEPSEHQAIEKDAPVSRGEKGFLTATETPMVVGESEKAMGGTGEEDDDDDDNRVYPSGMALALLTFGLCVANLAVALDNTILATAIPKITTVFPNSLKDVGWYGSSYLLTTTALQPSFGRLYTYFNVRNIYLVGICIFEAGSIVCATSQNSVTLIIGRALAGAGASALFSGGMTIIGLTVPLVKRPIYIACLSSMFGIASVIGPLLGGAFTDRVTWRWCFWINLPFGGIAIVAIILFFHPPPQKHSSLTLKQKILEIDLLGAALLICSIICLLLALQWGGTTYPWSDSKVWGCILGFGLMIIAFIAQQFRRGDRATIPPRIFGQRTVLFSSLYSCFLSMGLYVHIYFLPFYFQAIKGTTAEGSGIRTIPYLATIIISAMVVGGLITTIGVYKPFMIGGSAIFTIGAGMVYLLKVNSSSAKWIGYQLLSGIGAGAGVQLPFVAVQVVLSSKDMPSGNAIAIFFNSLGGAISISIAENVFSNGLYKFIPTHAPDIPVSVVIAAGASHLREAVNAINPASLPGVLQGYMDAITQSFIIAIAVGGIATLMACGVEWKSVKGKKIKHSAAA